MSAPVPTPPVPPAAKTPDATAAVPPAAIMPLKVESPPRVASTPPAPITISQLVISSTLNQLMPVAPAAPPPPEKLSPAPPPLNAPPPPPPAPVMITFMRLVSGFSVNSLDDLIHCSSTLLPTHPLLSRKPTFFITLKNLAIFRLFSCFHNRRNTNDLWICPRKSRCVRHLRTLTNSRIQA